MYYDYVSIDYINMLELNEIAKGLKVVFHYWYKPYEGDLYFLVEKDEATLKLDKALSPDRVCNLYFADAPLSFKPFQVVIPS